MRCFLSNSLLGAMPVSKFEDRMFTDKKIAETVRKKIFQNYKR